MRKILFVFFTLASMGYSAVTTDSIKAKGSVVVHKDSSYFASGFRALRLYTPQATIDSLLGHVKAGSSIGSYQGNDYIRLDYSQGALPGNQSLYLPVLKSTFQRIYFSNTNETRPYFSGFLGYSGGGTAFGLEDSTGTGSYKVYLSTKGGSYITGDFTTSTINTGNGDCEVYPVTSGTFACSLKTTDVTVLQTGTAHWTKIKDVVTVTFPALTGTSNSNFLHIYFGNALVANNIEPIGDITTFPAISINDGNPSFDNYFRFNKSVSHNYLTSDNSYTSSGVKGYNTDFSITIHTN